MSTHKLSRYAVVYGRIVEYFERPKATGRGEKYREPKRVKPQGYKGQYPNKESAMRAAKQWEIA